MTAHMTVSRDKWLEARRDLLAAEKDLTRRSDQVAQLRRQLPWVRVDKTYQFDTEEGGKTLKDLFGGRSQLLVYHFMFGPDYKAGCPSCSAIADGFDGTAVHLANHDVMLLAVSRAPLEKLRAFKQRMGWTFPWASSVGGDFNYDFNVSITEEQQCRGSYEYNYARGTHAMDGKAVSPVVAQVAAMTATVMTDVSMSPVLRHDVETCAGGSHAASGAAGWLGLAAAPTFAVMALWTGFSGGQPDMLCMGVQDASPLNGMTLMYALMSVFHAAPWLRLLRDIRRDPPVTFNAGRCR